MKRRHLAGWILSMFVATAPAYGGGAAGGVGGGITGAPGIGGGGPGFSGGIMGMPGHGGMIGMSGFGGCCGGSMFTGGAPMTGGGMGFGCCGGMMGMCGFPNGCWGNYNCQHYHYYGAFTGMIPVQTYSKWNPSPAKKYYYRTVFVHTPAPSEYSFEYVVVYHPDRPRFFYFFDPLEKKYFGRYELRAREQSCFNLLAPDLRKQNLKDIPNAAYRTTASMPLVGQVIRRTGGYPVAASSWQNVRLQRPPENVPDELLGLPPEEDFGPKKRLLKK